MKNINGIAEYITKAEAVKIGAAHAKTSETKEAAEKHILEELSNLEKLHDHNIMFMR